MPRTHSTLAFLAALLLAAQAEAHDARAVARYVPDSASPSGVALEIDALVDVWRFELSGRPGRPAAGEALALSVRATGLDGVPLDAPISLSAFDVSAVGSRALGPVVAKTGAGRYDFAPRFPKAGNYAVLLEFSDGITWHSLRFEHAVGQPGAPWRLLGILLVGCALLSVFALSLRGLRSRRGPAPEQLSAP